MFVFNVSYELSDSREPKLLVGQIFCGDFPLQLPPLAGKRALLSKLRANERRHLRGVATPQRQRQAQQYTCRDQLHLPIGD